MSEFTELACGGSSILRLNRLTADMDRAVKQRPSIPKCSCFPGEEQETIQVRSETNGFQPTHDLAWYTTGSRVS